jgi:hypothetical protein
MINSDQGIIYNASTVFAAFSRKNLLLIVRNPWKLSDFTMPEGFIHYTKIEGQLPVLGLDVMNSESTHDTFEVFGIKKYLVSFFEMSTQRSYFYRKGAHNNLTLHCYQATPIYCREFENVKALIPDYINYRLHEVDTQVETALEY